MTTKKFPNYMYEIVNLGDSCDLGTFSISASGEMGNDYAMMIFYRTDLFTAEQIRFKLVRSNAPSLPVYSNWITPKTAISNFDDSNHWIGRVKFDYDRQQMTSGTTVAVSLETQNYTHAEGGTQIGAILKYINSGDGIFDVKLNTAVYKAEFLYR